MRHIGERCEASATDQEPSIRDLGGRIRQVEADLLEQGLKLFPSTRAGQRAQLLWRKIKQHLFRGWAVQITTSALGLSWHREELKRARNVLMEMELIKSRPVGLYLLGRYDWLDEEVRDRFSELKVLEELMIALGSVANQVKDPYAA